VVTSASALGRMITDVTITVDKRTDRFTQISAHNVIVENGVRNPDGSWARDGSGNFIRNPALMDPDAKVIADKYRGRGTDRQPGCRPDHRRHWGRCRTEW
jgi:5'-nucleotidase